MRMPSLLLALSLGILLSGCLAGEGPSPAAPAGAQEGGDPPAAAPQPSDDPEPAPSQPEENGTSSAPDIALTVTAAGLYPLAPTMDADVTEIPAGANVTLTYRNDDLNPLGKHDLAFPAAAVRTEMIPVGEETTVTFFAPLEPGSYPYYCAVDGHRGFGMEGSFTVA